MQALMDSLLALPSSPLLCPREPVSELVILLSMGFSGFPAEWL